MSIYHYAGASWIASAQFRYANDRPPIALLSAKPLITQDQVSVIRRALESQGLHCVPAMVDGSQVLQVEGFKDEGQLAAMLQKNHFTSGQPKVTPEQGDHPTRSMREWLEDTSLKACGWGYVVGDVSLLASGLMSGRNKETVSGLLYTAGGLVLARYGNVKTEHHVRDVASRMGEFLQEQGAALPEECGLFSLLKDRKHGVVPRLEHFLYSYPSQTTIGVYTLGAFSMLQSGLKHGKFWDAAYGANSTLAGAASILIPEKKHKAPLDPSKPQQEQQPQGMAQQWWDWVQEKPLRVAGYAYILSGLALGMSAYREYQTNPQQKSYIFKFITTGTYLVSDLLMAISNKDHNNADGKFDPDEQRRLEALAAETIVRQPKEVREPLAHHVAGFLAQQPEMRGSAQEISDEIMAQVAGMDKHPWLCAGR